MSVPRTLLLSHGSAELRNAGEIFLRTLAAHCPPDRLCRFMYLPRGERLQESSWLGFPVAAAPALRQRLYRRFGEAAGSRVSLAAWEYARLVEAPRLVRQAVAFGRAQHVEQVWAVLNTAHVIHSARQVAEQLGVPLAVLVWDPPERIAAALGAHPRTQAAMLDDFAQVMRAATRVGLASEGMRDEYRRRYGVDGEVLIAGHRRLVGPSAGRGLGDPDRLVIGFAGSLYAVSEFDALVGALSACSWRVAGRDVKLRVLGRSLALDSARAVDIKWLGWRPVTDVIECLSHVDLCCVRTG